MIRRLHALFLRYCAVHAGRLRSVPLGPIWHRVGQVERVVRRGDTVELTGWADAGRVTLLWNSGSQSLVPDIPRPDVKARRGGRLDQGFSFAIPADSRDLRIEVHSKGMSTHHALVAHPSDPVTARGKRRLWRVFLRDCCRALPALLRYARTSDDRAKNAIKCALGLELSVRGAELERAWLLEEPPAHAAAPGEAIIVLPVFNALDLLKRCLARIERHTEAPWHLILVDDASSDPAVRPWLQAWTRQRPDRVTLICHDENKGFVGAANAGLRHAMSCRGNARAIVLLNSDAMVPSGWDIRLCAPLSDPSVASVTPMSNAAEIFSVPVIGPGVALKLGEMDDIDRVAQKLGAAPLVEAPTGVGFCMALSPRWLATVPQFDHVFGRGYGEEVDWCQKVRAMGARHLCKADLFVEHVGGQSFGSDEKSARISASGAMISRRYPRYDAEVQRFIANDPLATPRLALAIALAAARTVRLPVYLAHSLGGGAEAALKSELAEHSAAVVLRVGGPRRWSVEVHVADQLVAGRTDDLDLVRRLVAPAQALDLIYSCGVGDSDPVSLPAALLSLRRPGRDDRLAMRLHDYFPMTPSYTLLGRDGFTGVPAPDDSDPCHTMRRPDGTRLTLSDWRNAWAKLVEACDEIISFSQSSAQLFLQAYSAKKVTVRPHARPVPVRPLGEQAGRRIGILGNLNIQKGALVIRDLALAHPGQTFVVIGLVDSAIPFPRNVVVHGSYERDEITELTALYGIRAWLMPSIWPETFSFATREALATGLPVAGFALGAQGEALRDAPNGITVPLEPKSGAAERLFSTVDPAADHRIAAE